MAGTSGLLRATDVEAASAPSSTTVTTVPLTTTSLEPVVVTETRDVYDMIVVPTPPPTSAPASAPVGSGAPAPAAVAPVSSGAAAPPPAAVPPSTTTTTRPPGVPDDWPADEPIPPMPPGCQKPQLEDNGEWNCDH